MDIRKEMCKTIWFITNLIKTSNSLTAGNLISEHVVCTFWFVYQEVETCFLFELLGVEENSRFLIFGEAFRLARSLFFSKVTTLKFISGVDSEIGAT